MEGFDGEYGIDKIRRMIQEVRNENKKKMKNMKVIVVKHNEWNEYSGYGTTENPKTERDPKTT